MNELMNFGSEKKYSSVFLTEQINIFRLQEGGKELAHSDLLKKIRNEFEQELNEGKISPVEYKDAKGEMRKCYELDYEQSLQILMSESKSVRVRVIAILKELSKPKEISKKDLAYMLIASETAKEEAEERAKHAENRVAILTHTNKTYTTTEIAKELNMNSAIELNKLLSEKRIQFKQNGTWVLYSKYSNMALVDIKQEVLDSGKIIYHTRWTGIGRDFIINLLK